MMGNKPSLENMWNVIEQFGINRRILDPHGVLKYEQVEELYQTIEEKQRENKQIKFLQESIDQEDK